MNLRVYVANTRQEKDSIYERMLKGPRFSLSYATNGQNGEEVAKEIIERKPDFAVIDAVMSHADALTVLERINSEGMSVITIILMSAPNAIMETTSFYQQEGISISKLHNANCAYFHSKQFLKWFLH